MSAKKLSACFDLCRLTLQPNINIGVHFTENYLWQSHRKLVARRGFPVQLLLVGTLEFEPDNHIIILQFDLDNGNAPQTNREAHRHVRLETQRKVHKKADQKTDLDWHAELIKVDGSQIDIQLAIPSNEIIGCWHLKVFVGQQSANNQSLSLRESYVSAQQRTKLYLICNAFNVQDDSYFEQRSLRDYYLNQETDLWFSGTAVGSSSGYIFCKEPWLNSQFEENTMKTVMLLLERLSHWHKERLRGGLSYADRRNVARISRKLSFAVSFKLR